ncbi:MAG: DUF4132 domain-containing protein, partial [Acidimicrobiales bacterium]
VSPIVRHRPRLPAPEVPRYSGHPVIAALVNRDEPPPDEVDIQRLRSDEPDWPRLDPAQMARMLLTSAVPSGVYLWRRPDRPEIQLPTPLLISAVAELDGRSEDEVIQLVAGMGLPLRAFWPADEIRPWVDHHAEAVAAFVAGRGEGGYTYNKLLTLLVGVDPLPPVVRQAIVGVAVSGSKSHREYVDDVVDEDDAPAVAAYLASSRHRDRAGAARWLKQHPVAACTEQLLAAARTETHDGTKADLLLTLEKLRVPIAEFAGRDALLDDATRAMRKTSAMPASVSWLPIDSLPPLRWDDGSPVDREIVRWFVASAVRGRSAEPSPILRRHLAGMEPAGTAAFGAAVLDLWLAEERRTMDPEEARSQAEKAARTVHDMAEYHPEYAGWSLEAIADELYHNNLARVVGSASSARGLLALAAASAGAEVTDRVMAYVRRHRGQRATQVKALLQMLAWIDEPATIQAVLSVATRFRPQSIQNEALNQAQLLAERHDWSVEDLADRSVPDGGFDRAGRLVLDYGDRTFTARLADDLTVSLTNDESGKLVRSLPRGRADEDGERIKACRTDLSVGRKDVATAAKLQPDRLRQAMCAQRPWTADDLRRYVLDNPVMVRLATRLVWAAVGPDGAITGFRPLTDGTILDVTDEDVDLDTLDRITVAHQHLLGDEVARAWVSHLVDYEIQPLFPQFGRPEVTVDDGSTQVTDFVGYRHNDGSIRGQIDRLGWQLGPVWDVGIARQLVKDVADTGLRGVIDLSEGILLGAVEVGTSPVTLGGFYFVTAAEYPTAEQAVPLATVPPILLSELYAEVEAMAHAGRAPEPGVDREAVR